MNALTDREATFVECVPTGLLVGGEWGLAASGQTLPVDGPSTGFKHLFGVGGAPFAAEG